MVKAACAMAATGTVFPLREMFGQAAPAAAIAKPGPQLGTRGGI